MTLSPPATGHPSPQVISTITQMMTNLLVPTGAVGQSGTWPTAGTAYFFPVRIDQPRTFVRAWWLNGATAAGNVDVGIYTISGTTATRVVASTAEAQAGVSAMQVATTFTTTTLNSGIYWIAMACSLATATVWRSLGSIPAVRPVSFQALSAHPLPSTVTVAANSNGNVPVFGFSELTTI